MSTQIENLTVSQTLTAALLADDLAREGVQSSTAELAATIRDVYQMAMDTGKPETALAAFVEWVANITTDYLNGRYEAAIEHVDVVKGTKWGSLPIARRALDTANNASKVVAKLTGGNSFGFNETRITPLQFEAGTRKEWNAKAPKVRAKSSEPTAKGKDKSHTHGALHAGQVPKPDQAAATLEDFISKDISFVLATLVKQHGFDTVAIALEQQQPAVQAASLEVVK